MTLASDGSYSAGVGACPDCGGQERSALASGYWRCNSIIIDQQVVMMPAPGTPPTLGITVPMAQPVERVCGREYHEAPLLGDAEMMFCACGTGAIGRCVNDHRLVCGIHSALRENRRLCNECLARFDDDVHARQVDSRLRPLRLLLDHVARLDDPADRFLVLLLIRIHQYQFYGVEREAQDLLAHASLTLLPHTGDEPWQLGNGQPRAWTFDAGPLLQRWRWSNRLGTPVELQRVHDAPHPYKREMRTVVDGVVDAWQIQSGRAADSRPLSGDGGESDRYVLSDGTVAWVKFQSREVYNGRKVSLDDILMLAELGHLSIPPLPAEALAAFNDIIGIKALY